MKNKKLQKLKFYNQKNIKNSLKMKKPHYIPELIKSLIFFRIIDALKRNNDLTCNHCNSNDHIFPLIDYENIILLDKLCNGCIHKIYYSNLNKRQLEFIDNKIRIYYLAELLLELKFMNEKGKKEKIDGELRSVKMECEELYKESKLLGLENYMEYRFDKIIKNLNFIK